MRVLVAALLALGLPLGAAAEPVGLCYNYGCTVQTEVEVSRAQLDAIGRDMLKARDAESERRLLAEAVARLYRIAGTQTPIWRDKGGNSEDDAVEGRMDCIDHSTNTTHFIEVLAGRGWLRYHTLLPRQMRRRGLIFDHWTAAIEDGNGEKFAVDGWFFDYGETPAVIPFEDWLDGRDPEVRHRVAEAVQEQMERQVKQ
jgi:hypothetical protein